MYQESCPWRNLQVFLGVLENCGIHHNQIKQGIACEYKRRLRLILSSELSGRNKLQAINALALPVIRYTAGIVRWPVNTLEELDRQTRKLLTIHRGLHPRSDIDRLYLPRQKGGRGLCSVLDVVAPPRRMLFISLCEPE